MTRTNSQKTKLSAVPSAERRRSQARAPKPRQITEEYLEKAAFYYLGRYASSSANLRKVLSRKVWRREAAGAERPVEVENWLDRVVEKCVRLGLVDDVAYARSRAEGFLLKGRSLRRIEEELNHKGIARDIINATLTQLDPDGDADMQAAIRLAKKKRLGPFAPKEGRRGADPAKLRDRALGAFQRSGFSFDIARKVLEAGDEEALLAL